MTKMVRVFVLAALLFVPLVRAEMLVMVAGGGTEIDGVATNCRVHNPFGIDFDLLGNTYVVEMAGGERVLKIDPQGKLTVLAGTGEKGDSGDGGPAIQARFNGAHSLVLAVAVDSQGAIYVLERSGNALRKIERDGTVRTVAGTGKKGNDDGEALNATFSGPKHICVDASDNVIIADTDNHVIRKYLPKEERVIRIAGGGKDPLNQPHGVQVNKTGTLYIADSLNNRVLKVAP